MSCHGLTSRWICETQMFGWKKVWTPSPNYQQRESRRLHYQWHKVQPLHWKAPRIVVYGCVMWRWHLEQKSETLRCSYVNLGLQPSHCRQNKIMSMPHLGASCWTKVLVPERYFTKCFNFAKWSPVGPVSPFESSLTAYMMSHRKFDSQSNWPTTLR